MQLVNGLSRDVVIYYTQIPTVGYDRGDEFRLTLGDRYGIDGRLKFYHVTGVGAVVDLDQTVMFQTVTSGQGLE